MILQKNYKESEKLAKKPIFKKPDDLILLAGLEMSNIIEKFYVLSEISNNEFKQIAQYDDKKQNIYKIKDDLINFLNK